MKNFRIVSDHEPEEVWECKNGKAVSPDFLVLLLDSMAENDNGPLRTSSGQYFDPKKYTASELAAFVSDLIAMDGGWPRMVDSDEEDTTDGAVRY